MLNLVQKRITNGQTKVHACPSATLLVTCWPRELQTSVMLLLLLMMTVLHGLAHDYPYFSHETNYGRGGLQQHLRGSGRQILATFEPNSASDMNEYIWIDHK